MLYLVKLKADQSSNKRGSGCDSWNDLASDKLCLVTISRSDTIVYSTQVGCSSDEIDVEIAIIVFLEFSRCQTETSKA